MIRSSVCEAIVRVLWKETRHEIVRRFPSTRMRKQRKSWRNLTERERRKITDIKVDLPISTNYKRQQLENVSPVLTRHCPRGSKTLLSLLLWPKRLCIVRNARLILRKSHLIRIAKDHGDMIRRRLNFKCRRWCNVDVLGYIMWILAFPGSQLYIVNLNE